ncbi:MAG: sensor histidine kinase, partial [Sphingopyxis sp.]
MPFSLSAPVTLFERLPLAQRSGWVAYAAATVAAALGLGVRFALSGAITAGYPFITFFPMVIATMFLFGRWPAIYCATLCGLAAFYFFVEPVRTMVLNGPALLAMGFYTFIVAMLILFIDIAHQSNRRTRRERAKAERLAHTRGLLFRELQHRVANNIQVVGALVSASKRRVADPAARAVLEEAANRLTIIGRISRELYQADGERTSLDQYLRRLTDIVLDASGRSDVACTFAVAADLAVDAEQAVPMALVFTESLSNALEHGLPDGGGSVHIALARQGGTIALRVTDDG